MSASTDELLEALSTALSTRGDNEECSADILDQVKQLISRVHEERDALLEAGKQHAVERAKMMRRIRDLESRVAGGGMVAGRVAGGGTESLTDNGSELSTPRDAPAAQAGRSPTAPFGKAAVPPVALHAVSSDGKPPLSSRNATPRGEVPANVKSQQWDSEKERQLSTTNSFDQSSLPPRPAAAAARPVFVRDSVPSSRGNTPLPRGSASATASLNRRSGGSALGDFNTLGESASQVAGGMSTASRDRDREEYRRPDSRRETPARQRRQSRGSVTANRFEEWSSAYGSHVATGAVCVVLTWLIVKLFR